MRKILFLFFLLFCTLEADILFDKIKNLVSEKQFKIHNNLINLLFKDKEKFYITKELLNYEEILQTLKENGLLQLKFKKPTQFYLEFSTNTDAIKSLKILNETLKGLGYYYYFTKSTDFKSGGKMKWKISFKTEYALDPLILVKELKLKSCVVLGISKENNQYWKYNIDVSFAKIKEAIRVDNNEKIILQKPLKPYFIAVKNASKLHIIGRKLNHWFPYIVFYDNHLNVLKVIKKDRIYKGYKTNVPRETKYIKITDLYTLLNIKRGLSIIVK
jgi:hypothetical protein